MNLTPSAETALQAALANERYSEVFYAAVETWANDHAFPGLEGWARGEAIEEVAHTRAVAEYLNTRSSARLDALDAAPDLPDDYAGVLRALLGFMAVVTAGYTALADASADASDYATLMLAQKFLDLQRLAEHHIEIYLMRVERGASIDLLDSELYEDANG